MTRIECASLSSDPYLSRILAIVAPFLEGKKARILLFGSRAEGRYRNTSDYDLAIDTPVGEAIPFYRIRGELEDSTIPHKVDIVDLRMAGSALKNLVKEKGILLWEN